MRKHCIIGDVHGMYDALLALLKQIPKSSEVIFVGDLIDRGKDSKKVVKLVKNNYKAVLGNHEDAFIRFFYDYFNGMAWDDLLDKWYLWVFKNGGKSTLMSYGIWDNTNPSKKILDDIKGDVEYFQSLPLYRELDCTKNNLPVVISHSNISNVWHLKDKIEAFTHFKDTTLRTRDLKYNKNSEIFNIYGHTITKEPIFTKQSLNIDTGAFATLQGFGRLTGYVIEDDMFYYTWS